MTYTYSFSVGDFKCTVISDGLRESGWQGLHAFFPALPEEDFADAFHAHYGKTAKHSLSVLLVQTDERTILIDTGEGVNPEKPAIGKLLPQLESIGVAPEDIDTIVLTHTHGDHINGLVDGDGTINFPNAHYFMHENEWDYVLGEGGIAWGEDAHAKHLLAKLAQLKENVTLVKDGDSLIQGITFMDALGHSPGHMLVLLESKEENLLFLADTLLFEIQLDRLGWCPRFDLDTNQSVPTRKAILARAAQEKWLTLTYHFPFPGLGHYHVAGDGFSWQKI